MLSFILTLLSFSFAHAKNSCFYWEIDEIDQKVGYCINKDSEKLPTIDANPGPLRCTNWTYPMFWSCYDIYDDKKAAKQSKNLEKAAYLACGCTILD